MIYLYKTYVRALTSPNFTTQLGIDLHANLLDHASSFGWVFEGGDQNVLVGDATFQVANLLDGRVPDSKQIFFQETCTDFHSVIGLPIRSSRTGDGDQHLRLSFGQSVDGFDVLFGPIIGKELEARIAYHHPQSFGLTMKQLKEKEW